MAQVERRRELHTAVPGPDYFRDKAQDGWQLVAIEWAREGSAAAPAEVALQEVPYGLRVADDGWHLEENPDESRVLLAMLELIVQDRPLSRVAGELNQSGFRTRQGGPWTMAAVFDLLPYLIEAGPRLLTTEEWVARRKRLTMMLQGTTAAV